MTLSCLSPRYRVSPFLVAAFLRFVWIYRLRYFLYLLHTVRTCEGDVFLQSYRLRFLHFVHSRGRIGDCSFHGLLQLYFQLPCRTKTGFVSTSGIWPLRARPPPPSALSGLPSQKVSNHQLKFCTPTELLLQNQVKSQLDHGSVHKYYLGPKRDKFTNVLIRNVRNY